MSVTQYYKSLTLSVEAYVRIDMAMRLSIARAQADQSILDPQTAPRPYAMLTREITELRDAHNEFVASAVTA